MNSSRSRSESSTRVTRIILKRLPASTPEARHEISVHGRYLVTCFGFGGPASATGAPPARGGRCHCSHDRMRPLSSVEPGVAQVDELGVGDDVGVLLEEHGKLGRGCVVLVLAGLGFTREV